MAALFSIVFVYTSFFYRETLLKFNTDEKVNIFSGLSQVMEAFTHKNLRLAFFVWFVFVAGWWLFEAFLPAFLLNRFDFTSAHIGIFLASMGGTYALFQYLVVNKVAKNVKPETMVKGSLIISAASIFGIAFVRDTIQLHIVITIFVTSMGFALPGLISSISSLESKENQGKIMGNISSIQALSTVLMMMLGGYLDNFGITVTIIGGAALLFVSWLLFAIKFKPHAHVHE